MRAKPFPTHSSKNDQGDMTMPTTGANATIHGGGFHHIALRVYDFDATLKFYIDGLGFKRTYGWGTDGRANGEPDSRAAMLDTGDGNYLEVFAGGARKPGEAVPDASIRPAGPRQGTPPCRRLRGLPNEGSCTRECTAASSRSWNQSHRKRPNKFPRRLFRQRSSRRFRTRLRGRRASHRNIGVLWESKMRNDCFR